MFKNFLLQFGHNLLKIMGTSTDLLFKENFKSTKLPSLINFAMEISIFSNGNWTGLDKRILTYLSTNLNLILLVPTTYLSTQMHLLKITKNISNYLKLF